MKYVLSPEWRRVLSSLFVNLSAAWIGLVFIVPQFRTDSNWFFVLLMDLVYGIVCLLISVEFEKSSKI